MKERPILMSAPMVRAILDGSKTQTRRVCRHQFWSYSELHDANKEGFTQKSDRNVSCPCGQSGDRLYVRESYYQYGHWEPIPGVRTKKGRQKWKFVADQSAILFASPDRLGSVRKGRHHKDPETSAWHKRLGRFMPRKASRITLEIVSVRVERLNEISEEDAKAEGVPWNLMASTHKLGFENLWGSINGPESWKTNPWVWVVEFKRIEPSLDGRSA